MNTKVEEKLVNQTKYDGTPFYLMKLKIKD